MTWFLIVYLSIGLLIAWSASDKETQRPIITAFAIAAIKAPTLWAVNTVKALWSKTT